MRDAVYTFHGRQQQEARSCSCRRNNCIGGCMLSIRRRGNNKCKVSFRTSGFCPISTLSVCLNCTMSEVVRSPFAFSYQAVFSLSIGVSEQLLSVHGASAAMPGRRGTAAVVKAIVRLVGFDVRGVVLYSDIFPRKRLLCPDH